MNGLGRDTIDPPYIGLKSLIAAEVSCNACLMASFSDDDGIQKVKQMLYDIHPRILKSLEIEKITLFPKVAQSLADNNLRPLKVRKFIKKRLLMPEVA